MRKQAGLFIRVLHVTHALFFIGAMSICADPNGGSDLRISMAHLHVGSRTSCPLKVPRGQYDSGNLTRFEETLPPLPPNYSAVYTCSVTVLVQGSLGLKGHGARGISIKVMEQKTGSTSIFRRAQSKASPYLLHFHLTLVSANDKFQENDR